MKQIQLTLPDGSIVYIAFDKITAYHDDAFSDDPNAKAKMLLVGAHVLSVKETAAEISTKIVST
ncbi:MAG TPA: hypothetical protein VN721_09815 [Flavipsychrobacter sp.]|nr:hypothetical protein [Flavipsychrobacter sp.]